MSEHDLDWIEGFLDHLVASWQEHAVTPNGLFYPYLDRQWRRLPDGPRTLVSQCRVIYNFVRAYERSDSSDHANIARHGLEALQTYFRSADGAGWRWACHGDGSPQDDTYDAYGHAFVILAFGAAAQVLGDNAYRDLALQTWQGMQSRFRDPHGGLIWHIDPQGKILDQQRSQNPLMHAFEALLVLEPQDETGVVKQAALDIWRFLNARTLSPGCLPEWYDADWRPLREGQQAVIEIGHAFEWAFLLSEAQPLFPAEDLIGAGHAFLAYGMRHGYDHTDGGIVSRVDLTGHLVEQRKGWWEQCEAIRAISRYHTHHAAHDLHEPINRSIAFVRQHYIDHQYGGWYDNPPIAGGGASLDKGHAYKLDYHVLNLCRELLANR